MSLIKVNQSLSVSFVNKTGRADAGIFVQFKANVEDVDFVEMGGSCDTNLQKHRVTYRSLLFFFCIPGVRHRLRVTVPIFSWVPETF